MKVTMFSQVSIDGKLTSGKGMSSRGLLQLLDEDALRFIHRFRGNVDAIMVGRNTIATDNPSLTTRYDQGPSPVRVIPSKRLQFPEGVAILTTPEPTIIATTVETSTSNRADQLRRLGKEVVAAGKHQVDFGLLMTMLSGRGLNSLMVEGGGNVNWHMLKLGLIDEIILMQTPILIGGSSNITMVDGEGFRDAENAPRFELAEVKQHRSFLLQRFVRATRAGCSA